MFRNKTSNKLGLVGGPEVVSPQGTINSVICSLDVEDRAFNRERKGRERREKRKAKKRREEDVS